MDPQPRNYAWRSILLLIFSLAGAFIALGTATVLLGMFIVNERTLNIPAPLSTVLGTTTLMAIGLLLLPAGILSWQRLNGRAYKSVELPPLPAWGWAAFPLGWLLVLALATLLYDAPGARWYVPWLHFLAVAAPVYMLIRIGIASIPLGSSQRAWAVFTSGYSLVILLAITLEVLIVLAVVVVLGIFVGLNPELMRNLENLANRIEAARDIERLLPILAPLIKNPLTLVGALAFFSMFVPIVEELAKSIGVWLVADRLTSPAQGFAMGFLVGAGFALAESLSATITPDSTWALTFLTRGISSCMHMLASGLFGMGIAYFRLEKRFRTLAAMTCLAILLHAAWNAGAILAVAGGLRIALAVPQIDFPGVLLGLIGLGLLLLLGTSMVVSLVLLNLRRRSATLSAAGSQEAGLPEGASNQGLIQPSQAEEPRLE